MSSSAFNIYFAISPITLSRLEAYDSRIRISVYAIIPIEMSHSSSVGFSKYNIQFTNDCLFVTVTCT